MPLRAQPLTVALVGAGATEWAVPAGHHESTCHVAALSDDPGVFLTARRQSRTYYILPRQWGQGHCMSAHIGQFSMGIVMEPLQHQINCVPVPLSNTTAIGSGPVTSK